MERFAEKYLLEWKDRKKRKPLIIRGARQTGKTHLIEKIGSLYFENIIKIDFEFHVNLKDIFHIKDPVQIVNELSLYFDSKIAAGESLLFFDEIQECPEAINSLRYFYEKMPDLHVIAAGSLLEFVLNDFPYSMPVGRIEFLYLNPMTFEEFLLALNPSLFEYINKWTLNEKISDVIHEKLAEMLRLYFFVGGMPEAVSSYVETQSLIDVQRVQSSILTTMKNDFSKYGSKKQMDYLIQIMNYIPANLGRKIKYSNINKDVRSVTLKEALNLLCMSRLIHKINKSKANGAPLEAEISSNHIKPLFLDIGLVNNICGLNLTDYKELITVYEGSLAEQFIGQELLNFGYFFEDIKLHYWAREEKNSNAEIDYVIIQNNKVLPIEVKAGKTGSLKSLHLFLYEKKLQHAVRFNMDRPSIGKFKTNVRTKKVQDSVEFTLVSLPMYLVGRMCSLGENN